MVSIMLSPDNYSGYIFLYFIKKKSDTARALQKFLADVSIIGNVRNLLNLVPEACIRKLRSDNGGEFMGTEFKDILLKNKIRHEQWAPYSPHQNGIQPIANPPTVIAAPLFPAVLWLIAPVDQVVQNTPFPQINHLNSG